MFVDILIPDYTSVGVNYAGLNHYRYRYSNIIIPKSDVILIEFPFQFVIFIPFDLLFLL